MGHSSITSVVFFFNPGPPSLPLKIADLILGWKIVTFFDNFSAGMIMGLGKRSWLTQRDNMCQLLERMNAGNRKRSLWPMSLYCELGGRHGRSGVTLSRL